MTGLPTQSNTPFGPEIELRLRILESNLPVLLEGAEASEVKLVDHGDGTYGIQAIGTVGGTRREAAKGAVNRSRGSLDFLTSSINRLFDAIDDAGDAVPMSVRCTREAVFAEYEAREAVR